SIVEPVEKVRWQKLQEKRPPYLPFKRRSQIEEPFWYPHFGQFSVVRDFFYSLVRQSLRPRDKEGTARRSSAWQRGIDTRNKTCDPKFLLNLLSRLGSIYRFKLAQGGYHGQD